MITRTIHAIVVTALLSCLAMGCAFHKVTISYFDLEDNPKIHNDTHPTVKVSINGLSGHFVIDTASPSSYLTMTAVRRCGIAISSSKQFVGNWKIMLPLMEATNITVKLTPDFDIRFPVVFVLPEEGRKVSGTNDNFFGLLGYKTLAARHAVIDMSRKTLTMTK